jgi:hypothetical protein
MTPYPTPVTWTPAPPELVRRLRAIAASRRAGLLTAREANELAIAAYVDVVGLPVGTRSTPPEEREERA